jgi:hypothetical protein
MNKTQTKEIQQLRKKLASLPDEIPIITDNTGLLQKLVELISIPDMKQKIELDITLLEDYYKLKKRTK